ACECSCRPRELPSFPARRSSDLSRRASCSLARLPATRGVSRRGERWSRRLSREGFNGPGLRKGMRRFCHSEPVCATKAARLKAPSIALKREAEDRNPGNWNGPATWLHFALNGERHAGTRRNLRPCRSRLNQRAKKSLNCLENGPIQPGHAPPGRLR